MRDCYYYLYPFLIGNMKSAEKRISLRVKFSFLQVHISSKKILTKLTRKFLGKMRLYDTTATE
jgi:hypothetical protein